MQSQRFKTIADVAVKRFARGSCECQNTVSEASGDHEQIWFEANETFTVSIT